VTVNHDYYCYACVCILMFRLSVGSLWWGVGPVCSSQSESVPVCQLWQDVVSVGHAHSPCCLVKAAAGQFVFLLSLRLITVKLTVKCLHGDCGHSGHFICAFVCSYVLSFW